MVQLGKTGRIYVLNRENLGGYTPTNTTDPEEKAYANGLWGAPAYWNGNIYIWSVGSNLEAFSFANGAISSTYTSKSAAGAGTYSPTPSVSANGTTNGIVWSIRSDNTPEILYAHDALNVATQLYTSQQNSTRDNPGNPVKFIVPTVINGKVYVGSQAQLSVFGLLGGATQAATPVISPASQSFNPSIQVTITDSTAGASIYYTTDGSAPTTASTKYTAPFTLTTSSSVNAIAAGTGLLQSPEASATYTLTTQAAMPSFNPAPGSYSAVQTVSISTATPNATIYFTTDGTVPTTSSSKYTGPISVGVTETLSAIAAASGLSNSPEASGLYTVDLGGVSSINLGSGFTAGTMNLLGSAKLNGTALELTDGGGSEAAAAWYQVEANIQAFTSDFTFQITPASANTADGFTFAIQGNNSTSIGPLGGGLGYGPGTPGGTPGIANSLAVKFDLYSNAGEGVDSTGLYLNGVSPTTPAIDMTSSGVNIHSGNPFHVHMTYDGTTLIMTVTDTVTNANFTHSWAVDIPTTVGGTVAYIGFTAGTGGSTATQNILNWTYVATTTGTAAATPAFNPPAGTYLGTQSVSLTDSTTGATIYYTTDGSTPTTSSTQYTAPITVTATETINAIATATGFTTSPVGSALYTIESQVAAPAFSPAAGSYSSSQTVTISTTSTGATIYYTTNGTAPTTTSTQYTAPITVSASETIQAIAVASGFFNSNVSTASYTINSGVTVVNLGSGFTTGAMILNGKAILNGTRLRVTDGGGSEASSAWYNSPVSIQQFTSNFSFQITGGTAPTGDGFAFVIQGGTTTALGPPGGGLGYGPDTPTGTPGLPKSVAVKFDLYSNAGEGTDSTGLYINGASPTTPAVDMTSSGVNLHTTDVFNVQLTYDGTNLTMTITDATTNATFTHSWPINIPTTVGANTAYVGFTGGTGGNTAIQEIIGWTLASSSTVTPAATPTLSPAPGSYTTAQSVTISDTTTGATIYYTTNGTTPTTGSTVYSVPISVNAAETIQAIAAAPGFSQSAVASGAYTINLPAVATPTFSPAAGVYSSTQSVTISDTTSGATIYYTTNGTTPTTGSTVYSAPITVNATETIQAIATGTGYTPSAVASSAYTINLPAAATPTFSPAAGVYASAQSVTISDTTSGATIYYTTNGTTPTTGSTVYSAPISVNATETIQAIAIATGFSQSAVASGAYTISLPSTINYAAGFSSAGLALNGSTTLNGTRLRLTDGGANEAASGWYATPVNIQTFSSDFTFQLTTPTGDGYTFTIQNAGTTAVGPSGGGLGYGPDNPTNPTASVNTPIAKSVAIKFDLYSNAGEGANSTGLYVNGASPTMPATPIIGGVNLHSGDIFKVHLNYDGTTLTMTITDTVNPTQTFTTAWTINIPSTVGGNTAYVGFTGGTGGSTATQEIITWSYNNSFSTKHPVIYQTAKLTAVSSGPTFRQFTYTGFPDTTGTILDATKVGDNVTFTLNVATAGIYDVQLSDKKFSSRGISQLSISGTNLGATLDQYAATDSYAVNDYGTFNFTAAGNYAFKFSVTGKNAASSNYGISFDDIVLTPQ